VVIDPRTVGTDDPGQGAADRPEQVGGVGTGTVDVGAGGPTGHGDREHGDIDRGMQAEQGGDEQGDRERGEGVVVVVHEVSLSVEEEVWCAVRWVRVDKVRAG